MATITTQVVVVGAGPAGAAAAFFLAQAGINVALVDQATFPRDKVCGDAICPGAMEILAQMGLAEWAHTESGTEFTGFFLGSPDHSVVQTRPAPGPRGHLIPRRALDAALVQRAVAAGAHLYEQTRITGLERPTVHRVQAIGQTDGHAVTFEAPLVIAADGGISAFTRTLGLVPPGPADIVAVRGYFEGDAGPAGRLEIHWEKSILPGYGWLFHLQNGRANVGLGMYVRDVHRLRISLTKMLETFIAENPYVQTALQEARLQGSIKGHPLRTDADRIRPFTDNVLVAGEAAGLVSPVTGEGVGPSLDSGRLAADHARRALEQGTFSAGALAAYGREFHRRFDSFHRAARLVRIGLGYPWIVNRTIRRASHDPIVAQALDGLLNNTLSPAVLLKPAIVLRILAG